MRTLYYEGLVPAGQVINARAEREVVELATPQREASIFGSVGPNLVAINLSDFVAQPLPQRQYVIAPILPERVWPCFCSTRSGQDPGRIQHRLGNS